MKSFREIMKEEKINEAKNLSIIVSHNEKSGVVDIVYNGKEDSKISDILYDIAPKLAEAYTGKKFNGLLVDPMEVKGGQSVISVYRED